MIGGVRVGDVQLEFVRDRQQHVRDLLFQPLPLEPVRGARDRERTEDRSVALDGDRDPVDPVDVFLPVEGDAALADPLEFRVERLAVGDRVLGQRRQFPSVEDLLEVLRGECARIDLPADEQWRWICRPTSNPTRTALLPVSTWR